VQYFLIILYPFAKRWMSLPQVVLGVTFNWGIFMANSALTQEVSLYSLVCLWQHFFWTVGYDSIYGILDYEYDKKIKVKSSVVKFGQYTDVFVVFCYGMFLLLMVFLGYLINAGILYYGILLLVTLHMFWQIKTITFTNLEKNLEVFKSNFYVGILIWIALLLA
jgi:4-hydroxybenzoate polyprenyltransferase